jgi:hypothetical protein
MAGDNADLAVAELANLTGPIPPAPLVIATPLGVRTTLAVSAGVLNSIDLDQDGSYVIAVRPGTTGGAPFALQRVTQAGGVTTIVLTPTSPNWAAIDGDTGDYVIALFNTAPQGALLRVHRTTLAITTIAPGLGTMSGVDFEPRTGSFVCTRFDQGQVLRVTRAGVVTTLLAMGGNNAIVVDDETGEFLAAGGGTVNRFSPAGLVIATRSFPGVAFTGVELYGSRKVSGSGDFRAGSTYRVRFSFPRSGGSTYAAAMSFSLRPGIALGDGTGRMINLAIDPLLLLSLGGLPGVTTGFAGVLDASGRAGGTITLPAGFPPGVRVHVSAVAVNAGLPSGLDTANSWGVTSD